MLMYSFMKNSDNYSKTLGSSWQYYRDEPLDNTGAIADFPAANNNSALLKFEIKIASRIGNDGTKLFELWYH